MCVSFIPRSSRRDCGHVDGGSAFCGCRKLSRHARWHSLKHSERRFLVHAPDDLHGAEVVYSFATLQQRATETRPYRATVTPCRCNKWRKRLGDTCSLQRSLHNSDENSTCHAANCCRNELKAALLWCRLITVVLLHRLHTWKWHLIRRSSG